MSGGSGPTGNSHSIELGPDFTFGGWVPGNVQQGQSAELRFGAVMLADDAEFEVVVRHADSRRELASGSAEWNGVTGSFSWDVDLEDDDFGVDGIASLEATIMTPGLSLIVHFKGWTPTAYVKRLDASFAPGVPGEELVITYGITDLSKIYRSGLIRVFGTESGDEPIFQRRLDFTDIPPFGLTRDLQWSGNAGGIAPNGDAYEVPSGPFEHDAARGKFANILHSPYLVQVLFWDTDEPGDDAAALASPGKDAADDEKVDGQNVTHVEIASTELRPSSFFADETTIADDPRRFQLALHRAGYSCGPVDGDLGKDNSTEEGRNLIAGVRDFQRCHWETPWPTELLQRTPLVIDGDPGTKTRQAAEDPNIVRRRVLENGRLPQKNQAGKIFVYDNVNYTIMPGGSRIQNENNNREWNATPSTPIEFGNDFKHERDRLNTARPWIPIELRVLVKGRTGSPVFAPLAVGNVRVDWNVVDPAEDLTQIGAANTYIPRKYVDDAMTATRNSNAANPGFDNAPPMTVGGQPGTFVGVRGNSMNDYLESLFTVTNDDGTVGAIEIENNLVKKRADIAGGLAGRSYLVFRPSIMAGDNYKITAQVNFDDDDANKDALLAKYVQAGAPGDPFRAETGTMTVWRKVRVAAYITWGAITGPADPDFVPWEAASAARSVESIYRKAHMIFDGDGLDDHTVMPASRTVPIQSLFSPAEYHRLFGRRFQGANIAMDNLFTLPFVQAQRATETGVQYMRRLRTDTRAWWNDPQYDLCGDLGKKVRRLFGPGWIVVNHEFHKPRLVFTNITNDNGVRGIGSVRGQKERLRDLGLFAGPIDNAKNLVFEQAVEAFQGSRGLTVDGDVGPYTREELLEQHHLLHNPGQVVIPSHVQSPANIGLHNGFCFLVHDVGVWKNLGNPQFAFQPAEKAYVTTHEMGHSKYRMHHVQLGNPSTNPTWHDTNYNTCVMAYPSDLSTSQPGSPVVAEPNPADPMLTRNMRPEFCGKCLLGLRGWPVTGAAGMPALPANS